MTTDEVKNGSVHPTVRTRRSRLRAVVATGALAVTAAVALSTAPPALAEANPTLDGNYDTWDAYDLEENKPERCADTSDLFRFRFYFNSNYGGSFINIGHPIWDLLAVYMGSGPQPLRFCGGPSAGMDQVVGNNAASGYNWYEGYCATVYYYHGYAGAKEGLADEFSPRSGHNLGPTYNENRSINFRPCW
ncbi:hypothetical protein [Streptomyces sp. NPDC093225]|uniref:hypothetical protein n=1 Tax=Streptomyces sp. NPDC093225 TaxID=3366034 RepID=UPI0037F41FB0